MNPTQPVAVIGSGGHATVVVSMLVEAGYDIVGLFDDDIDKVGSDVLGFKVLGRPEDAYALGFRRAIVAIGDNRARFRMVRRLPDLEWITVIHPGAHVHSSSRVGPGTVVMVNCVVRPETVIGAHAIINTSTVVGHHCAVEDFVHVAGSSHLGGSTRVATGAFLGMGTIVNPGKAVGAWAVVGSGGVVVDDIPARVTAVGVPARLIQIHKHDQEIYEEPLYVIG